MSRTRSSRVVLLLALAISLAGCGGSNDTDATESATTTPTAEVPTTTTETTATAATTTAATTTAAATTVQARQVTAIPIKVVDGKPQGGIARPSVEHDARVVLIVKSDTADEVHLHGYDLSVDVAAGGTARLAFTATIRGRFEVELEQSGVQIAELTVT